MPQERNSDLKLDDTSKVDHSNIIDRSVRLRTVALFAQAISYLIKAGSTVIIARLLAPRDFGSVAMVTSTISFMGLFQYLVLSGAIIQRRSLSRNQITLLNNAILTERYNYLHEYAQD